MQQQYLMTYCVINAPCKGYGNFSTSVRVTNVFSAAGSSICKPFVERKWEISGLFPWILKDTLWNCGPGPA